MKPEEIIPPLPDEFPSPAREGLRDIVNNFELVEKNTTEKVIHVEGNSDRGAIIKIQSNKIDFQQGKEILKLKIETERADLTFEVDDVWASQVAIEFYGYHTGEKLQIFP